MAQKFGNGRWVQEGFLDNRVDGTVVGRIVFAVIGRVDVYLRGNFKADIVGQVIQFRNRRFEHEDLAGQVIGDMVKRFVRRWLGGSLNNRLGNPLIGCNGLKQCEAYFESDEA